MAGVVPSGVINSDALSVTNVLAMNDATQGIRNLIQQGNMIPGLNEIAEQAISLTQHAVALHSRVTGLGDKVDKMGETVDTKIKELKASEVNLTNAVSAKISEIEGKSNTMKTEVQQAISGIAE